MSVWWFIPKAPRKWDTHRKASVRKKGKQVLCTWKYKITLSPFPRRKRMLFIGCGKNVERSRKTPGSRVKPSRYLVLEKPRKAEELYEKGGCCNGMSTPGPDHSLTDIITADVGQVAIEYKRRKSRGCWCTANKQAFRAAKVNPSGVENWVCPSTCPNGVTVFQPDRSNVRINHRGRTDSIVSRASCAGWMTRYWSYGIQR